MPAIRTEGLTKHYAVGFWRPRPYVALDALTLDVAAGEVFGFLGPNGAGKTTTLKLLMQLIPPTSGRAEILGRPVGDAGVKRRIGYLPENPYFYDNLTAEELLSYFASLFGYGGAERRRRVTERLDEVGLGAERRLQLRKLSKGTLQRVGLAQALVNDPEVVFLDEPMSGLDPIGRREVHDLILRLRDRGVTVFFSSHVLSDAEALCSHVAILAGGRLVSTGRVSDVVAFGVQGWDVMMTNLTDALADEVRPRARSLAALGDGRYQIVLPADASPEHLIAELSIKGARLASVNPLRQTLEDYFVRQVQAAAPARREV